MAHLSEFDQEKIRILRAAGVLEDVNPHRLDQEQGVIMMSCADGDQQPDVFRQQTIYQRFTRGRKIRIHTLCLNGGAIALPVHSPLNQKVRVDDVLMENLEGAMYLKGISVIALYAHAPCGAAGIHGLNVLQVIDLLVSSKKRIKGTYPETRVACFFHVDYGDRKRTYFVSKMKWKEWKAYHPECFSSN